MRPELTSCFLSLATAVFLISPPVAAQNPQLLIWGANDKGQLNVPTLPGDRWFVDVASGQDHSLGILNDGTCRAWGWNVYGQCNVPTLPAGLSYKAIAGGESHSLALRSDGSVICWGANGQGQLNVPALPAGVTYTAVAAGYDFSIALRSNGTLIAWGRNDYGQCNVPTLPAGLTYASVACGNAFSLARRSDGSVVAWGQNNFLQCSLPVLPPGTTLVELEAGTEISFASRSDGVLLGWGNCANNACSPPATQSSNPPVQLSAFGPHAMCRLKNGDVIAWGWNSSGQCNVPPIAAGLSAFDVAGGLRHSLMLLDLDCNDNGVRDSVDILNGEEDCNANGIPDTCDLQTGTPTCNRAIQLNGTNHIRVNDSPSLDLTGAMTIECWVKTGDPTKPLVMKWGDDGINDRSYSVTFMPDQKFQFGVARSDNQIDSAYHAFLTGPFPFNQWRHIACTYDGFIRSTYIDGVLVGTKLTSGPAHIGTTALGIGAHLGSNAAPVSDTFVGLIDEVRIWNVARSQEQIRSTINKRLTPGVVGGYSGLVSCWNFEGNANDAKGTNNGNPVGAPTYVLASDQPVLFDCNGNGVYDGEEVGSNPALDLNNNGILDACECTLSSVCQTSPNSAGTGALMSYAGNSSLSGSLTLLATGCPTNVSGFFFYGTQPALVPLGNGWRCIGGTIARLPVVNTGATGVGARTLNYAQLPPNGPITAGSTKYFQFYYRDVQGGGSGFNLSNSLKVLFCP
jgi:hypothetical protein